MPGPLRGAGGSAPHKGRRPKCGGLLCPPGASAPYGGSEASAPPSRRGGPGGRGVDGVRRVSPLEVFLPLGRINRVCESLRQRERMIMARDGNIRSRAASSDSFSLRSTDEFGMMIAVPPYATSVYCPFLVRLRWVGP